MMEKIKQIVNQYIDNVKSSSFIINIYGFTEEQYFDTLVDGVKVLLGNSDEEITRCVRIRNDSNVQRVIILSNSPVNMYESLKFVKCVSLVDAFMKVANKESMIENTKLNGYFCTYIKNLRNVVQDISIAKLFEYKEKIYNDSSLLIKGLKAKEIKEKNDLTDKQCRLICNLNINIFGLFSIASTETVREAKLKTNKNSCNIQFMSRKNIDLKSIDNLGIKGKYSEIKDDLKALGRSFTASEQRKAIKKLLIDYEFDAKTLGRIDYIANKSKGGILFTYSKNNKAEKSYDDIYDRIFDMNSIPEEFQFIEEIVEDEGKDVVKWSFDTNEEIREDLTLVTWEEVKCNILHVGNEGITYKDREVLGKTLDFFVNEGKKLHGKKFLYKGINSVAQQTRVYVEAYYNLLKCIVVDIGAEKLSNGFIDSILYFGCHNDGNDIIHVSWQSPIYLMGAILKDKAYRTLIEDKSMHAQMKEMKDIIDNSIMNFILSIFVSSKKETYYYDETISKEGEYWAFRKDASIESYSALDTTKLISSVDAFVESYQGRSNIRIAVFGVAGIKSIIRLINKISNNDKYEKYNFTITFVDGNYFLTEDAIVQLLNTDLVANKFKMKVVIPKNDKDKIMQKVINDNDIVYFLDDKQVSTMNYIVNNSSTTSEFLREIHKESFDQSIQNYMQRNQNDKVYPSFVAMINILQNKMLTERVEYGIWKFNRINADFVVLINNILSVNPKKVIDVYCGVSTFDLSLYNLKNVKSVGGVKIKARSYSNLIFSTEGDSNKKKAYLEMSYSNFAKDENNEQNLILSHVGSELISNMNLNELKTSNLEKSALQGLINENMIENMLFIVDSREKLTTLIMFDMLVSNKYKLENKVKIKYENLTQTNSAKIESYFNVSKVYEIIQRLYAKPIDQRYVTVVLNKEVKENVVDVCKTLIDNKLVNKYFINNYELIIKE